MSAIEGVVAYQGWSLRGVPLYYRTEVRNEKKKRKEKQSESCNITYFLYISIVSIQIMQYTLHKTALLRRNYNTQNETQV